MKQNVYVLSSPGTILLTCINFILGMDDQFHPLYNVR